MAEDDYAIVVGITHYPGLSNLEGSENDAEAFAEWLRSPSGGDVPEDNIKLILSSQFRRMSNPAKAKPTEKALKDAIDNLHDIGLKNNSHVGRRLYLFLAGHGIAREIHEAALLMANAVKERTGYKIPGEPYAEWFKRSAFFAEVVLFMDCCLEENKLSPPGDCHLDPVSGGRKRARSYYGLASDLGQPSKELPDKDKKMRGVFTSALLAGLWQGPPDGGDVTGIWLAGFVPQYMSERLGSDIQDPQFFYQQHKDIVFVKRAAANGQGQTVEKSAKVKFRVRIHAGRECRNRTVEMRDGLLKVIPPSTSSNGSWEWELGPGLYAYGYAGDEPQLRQLMGEGEEIDVQL